MISEIIGTVIWVIVIPLQLMVFGHTLHIFIQELIKFFKKR